MEPRRFELSPEIAPDVLIHVADGRETLHPDQDLIEIGFRAARHDMAFSVALAFDELVALRDGLTQLIDTQLP